MAPPELPRMPIQDYMRLELRVGLVLTAESFEPDPSCLRLWIDFGPGIGVRRALPPLVALYDRAELPGRLVVAVLNVAEEPASGFPRECRVLTVADRSGGHTLVEPDHDAEPGQRVL